MRTRAPFSVIHIEKHPCPVRKVHHHMHTTNHRRRPTTLLLYNIRHYYYYCRRRTYNARRHGYTPAGRDRGGSYAHFLHTYNMQIVSRAPPYNGEIIICIYFLPHARAQHIKINIVRINHDKKKKRATPKK